MIKKNKILMRIKFHKISVIYWR